MFIYSFLKSTFKHIYMIVLKKYVYAFYSSIGLQRTPSHTILDLPHSFHSCLFRRTDNTTHALAIVQQIIYTATETSTQALQNEQAEQA